MKRATASRLILVIPFVSAISMPAGQDGYGHARLAASHAQAQERPSYQHKQERIVRAAEQEKDAFDRFVAHESRFKDHYQANFLASHYEYHQYRPAYQHGFELGLDPRYERADWNSVEPDARRTWVESTMGLWSQYRDAVRYGWEQGVALKRK